MSELTREKKCQIAAMAVKGKTAEEIAAEAKVDIEAVKALLATRGTEKTVDGMSMQEKKDYAVRLYHQGKKHKEIMEITGLSRSTVYTLIPVEKDKKPRKFKKAAQINEDFDQAINEMIADIKKEPAPAATDTDSDTKNEIKHISTNNDTIDLAVCQDALERAVRGYLGIYEQLTEAEQRAWELGEAFAELARARGLFV